MKKGLALFFALIAWFAVITQLVLMIENRVADIPETLIRFFSFFTILTNTLVALYFTYLVLPPYKESKWLTKPGTLTAITIYITMVGSVYQIALRHIWQPQGMQLIVDELLHTIIPVLVIIFWFIYEDVKAINYSQILTWAIYPLVYLLFILIRGACSNFYPYPFVNVTEIGLKAALLNSGVLMMVFIGISALFIFVGKLISKR